MNKLFTSKRLKLTAGICAVALLAIGSGYALNSHTGLLKAADEGTVIYSNTFAAEADFNKCSVVKGESNTSNNQWKYYKYGPNIQYSIYMSDSGHADSYLFIPDVAFDSSKYYTIGVKAMNDANNDDYHAVLEFGYATSANISDYTAVNEVEITDSSYAEITSNGFSTATGATYAVLRVHFQKPEGITAGYMGLKVKDLVVKQYNEAPDNGNNGGNDDDDPNQGGNTGGDDDDSDFEDGPAKPLPYSIVPTSEELSDLTMLDNNGDEDDHGTYVCGVWGYDAKEEALTYLYSMTDDADDYVFLPLLDFNDASKGYEITLDYMCASRNNPESFEICIGKHQTAESMKVIYQSGRVVNDEDWKTVSVPVGIQQAGKYYVGIHCTSSINDFRLYVKNISVKQMATSPDVPLAPESITAIAGERGALTAEISFTMPTLNIANKALTGDVTVVAKSSVEEKSVTAPAGQKTSLSIKTVQGNNNITLTSKNANGTGNSATVSVYTGVDVPKAPVLTPIVSEDNMSLVINWNQEETGVNGGYVDPATVTYTIYHYDADKKDYDDGTIQTGKTGYTFTAEPGSSMRREAFFITAKNAAGQEEGAANSAAAVIGTPYTLPMVETLPKGKETYSPLTATKPGPEYSSYGDFRTYSLGTIFETTDEYYEGIMDGHSNAIWGFNRYENGKCRFDFPKFSTKDINETKFKMNVFINSIFPDVEVYASSYSNAPIKIGTITKDSGSGWTTLAFVIPDTFADTAWVQVSLDTEFTDYELQNIFISDYSLTKQMVSDMALEDVSGTDDALSVGEESTYIATVRNEGKTTAAAPSVKFTLIDAEGNVIDTKTVASNAMLAPEATADYEYTLTTSADNLGDLTLRAAIVENDDNNDNNEGEISVSVVRGLKPIVNDLSATGNEGLSTVDLTWSKPDIKLTGRDDFESYEPFEYGKYIGNFKNVDLDGKKTYSYDQSQFDAATLPKAFMVVNPDYLNNKLVAENYTPHSGKQYLVAFCPADGSKANDWLISPEVKPGTVVSFYVSTVVLSSYNEEYEICYSTTGNNPSDFKVLEKKTANGVDWKGVAVMLPEDAKYFAIHYVSMDVFGLMIDDIDFTPVINEGSDFKYNVYENGELIASALSDTEYKVTGVTSFDNLYNVTSVVDGKEYAFSNTAIPNMASVDNAVYGNRSMTVVGRNIVLNGYEGCNVAIFSADGRTVYSGRIASASFTVTLPQGIYVVKAAGDVRKFYVN